MQDFVMEGCCSEIFEVVSFAGDFVIPLPTPSDLFVVENEMSNGAF